MSDILKEIPKINPTAVEFPENVELGSPEEFTMFERSTTAQSEEGEYIESEDEGIIETEKIFNDLSMRDNKEMVPMTLNLFQIIKRSAINLILPFINGMMLGFGEILAHEVGFRYSWVGARVQPPRRMERRQLASKFL